MSVLPIIHMTLYKHGVGYYRRRGAIEGEAVKLSFRQEEMDDLLKSLTIIDYSKGQVRGVDYDTPQSQAEKLAGCSIILDDARSLRDLLRALRGRKVQLALKQGQTEGGALLGLDEDETRPMKASLVSLLADKTETVNVYPISQLSGVTLQDNDAAEDLRFFLKTALGQESHRSITIRLSPGEHDLEVSYIAPAPTWRVSYRLVMDAPPDADAQPKALLQGWGIFDNQLEEDLSDITLSLTAGMPISFVYDLYTPHTPERPTVEDEDRSAAAPVMFEEAMQSGWVGEAPSSPAPMMRSMGRKMAKSGVAAMGASVQSAAEGKSLGELFQYTVSAPVTVGRGQSAMVPIVSSALKVKKDLIYNGNKMPVHPVATLRFDNSSGLTLERGPVTVLENGEYVGEAVLPFTVNTAEAVIAYAVELSVHVQENTLWDNHLHTLSIRKGYLLQQHYQIKNTIYKIDNRSGKSKAVLIEFSPASGYTIFDTPDPAEKTLNTRRYAIEAAPGQITTFTAKERTLRSQKEEIRSLKHKKLQAYFKDNFLDEKSYRELEALLKAWDEISQLEKQINKQEKTRKKIYAEQEQVQKNMQVLSNRGDEGRLRSRYVQQLTQSEEDLTKIAQTIKSLQEDIAAKKTEIDKMTEALGE
ncbi:MAG TPA: hypothetical protein G4N96_09850 [Chloroflexi bacterium]|nr:hypothetical protein [Chloroflexota bacterium]